MATEALLHTGTPVLVLLKLPPSMQHQVSLYIVYADVLYLYMWGASGAATLLRLSSASLHLAAQDIPCSCQSI